MPLLFSWLLNTVREKLCKTCRLLICEFQSQMRPCSAVLSFIYSQTLLFPSPIVFITNFYHFHEPSLPSSIPFLKGNCIFTSYQKKKKKSPQICLLLQLNVSYSHLYTTSNFLRYSIGVYSFPRLIQPASCSCSHLFPLHLKSCSINYSLTPIFNLISPSKKVQILN